jgi:hypothetical protein
MIHRRGKPIHAMSIENMGENADDFQDFAMLDTGLALCYSLPR